MASSSSSGGDRKYDVFLSFRGEDTRKTFVGHFYDALIQKAMNAYQDSKDLEKGNKILELLEVIEDSRISIVVLSQNYASSKWCLRELAKIMDCRENKKQIVVPIFYDVDPSDVRNINGTFAQAFANHEANTQLTNEELESWRLALTRVADLSGWDSRDYKDDHELIKNVVGDTLSKCIHTSSYKANKDLVGMDSHITEMNAKLCLEVNDVRVVGIWGMGGLGKTTIAEAVYGEIACDFEHSCFVRNVKYKREAEVQEELLLSLLKEKGQGIDLQRGRDMIMKRLDTRKVLVVLDDVLNFSQIKELLGEPHAFGKGSRIFVTTRDQQSPKEVDETYHPGCLNQKNSCELLVKHAFRKDPPSEEYIDLLNQAVKYADGLPLALKVLGASLYDKNIHEWKDVLEKIKIIPDRKIMDVLRISFEGLDVLEQQIFLDIACLFRGWNHLEVTEILHGLHPHIGFKNLVNRALVTIDEDEDLDMHDLLQEMGREIVRREYIGGPLKEPGQYSRLWSFEDVDQVLTQNTATDAIECLMMLGLPYKYHTYCINVGAFARMTKLRVLIIRLDYDEQVMRGELEFLSPELRLLQWDGYPLESLPNTFIPKNLVILDMSFSDIQQLWEGTMPLQNLKEIRLTSCHSLVKIPDLTEAIHLKKLDLNDCSSLLELHSSISALQELEYLTLEECKQLKILPSSLHMKSLETLKLSRCSNLEKFPEISDVMSKLQELDLAETAIKELPESINNLTGLCVLNLSHKLTTLPSSIHLSLLGRLDLRGCSNLENFPEISGIMKELSELYLDGTAVKRLPSSIHLLEGLKKLTMQNCKSLECLPDSICNLAQLTHLDLSGCSALHNLPEQLGDLQSLAHLQLLETGIKHFPLSIVRLLSQLDRSSLEYLHIQAADLLSWSSLIRYYSFSSVVHLDLSDCNLLELCDDVAQLSSLKTLKLCRNNLESLPVTMNRLGCLTHLELEGCNRLKSIPELSSINFIDAHCCTALETVSIPKTNSNGTSVDLRFSNCSRLQANFFREIVETHSLNQDDFRPSCVYMCLPGSEIPEWFDFKDTGCSLSLHVPMNSFSDKILGLSICIAINFRDACHDVSNMYGRCYWTSKGNRGEYFFKFDVLSQRFRIPTLLESDHLFMAYLPHFGYGWTEEDRIDAFEIVVETGTYFPTEDCFPSSYGVCLVYANHEEMQNSVTRPILHLDGQSMEDVEQQKERCCAERGVTVLGAPSFPDQLEIRKSETEWEAESSETAGGRVMCQTLEILPEPLTGTKEKFEIMLAAAQGEGCHVSGSVCCCVSLSGCNMSMKRREAQRKGDRVTMDSSRADISELGSHRGLVVPNSHYEGQEETEMMGGEESLPARGLLGLLCSCFLPVWKEKVNYGVEREK